MKAQPNLDQLSNEQMRALAARLLVEVEQKQTVIDQKDRANRHLEAFNEKLAYENALLKRHRFTRRSASLNQQQRSLVSPALFFFVTT